MAPIRLGTRTSDVALRRARQVAARIAPHAEVEVVPIKVDGERRLAAPIDSVAAQGFFTKQLTNALRRRRVDVCVHAGEDLDGPRPDQVQTAAVISRADPADVVLFYRGTGAATLAELTSGSRVGASGWRRRAQMRALRPDLEVVQFQGDLAERVRKLDRGAVHAMVASWANLEILGVTERPCERLEAPAWLTSAGQGTTVLQIRAGDDRLRDLLAPLHDVTAGRDLAAERAVVAGLIDGAQAPVCAQVVMTGVVPVLHGLIADPEGETVVRGDHTLDPSDPEGTGQRLASILLLRGGERIIEELREREAVPHPQFD